MKQSEEERLRITKIEMRNVGCLEKFEIKPGTWTVIEGRNATGKTTALNGLRSLVDAGHDPTLLRRGADKATITVTLADGVTITETITADKTTRVVRHPKMGKISRTREWIQSIIDSVAFDPAAFLTAKAKDRVAIFLEAMPLRLTKEQLAFLPPERTGGIDFGQHALTIIGDKATGLYGYLFQLRTETNRVAKQRRSTAEELGSSIPEVDPEDKAGQRLQEIDQQLQDLQQTTATRKREVEFDASKETTRVHAEAEEEKTLLYTELNSELDRVRGEYGKKINALTTETQRSYLAIAQKQEGDMEAIRAGYEPELKRLTEERGSVAEKVQQQKEAAAARKAIEKIEAAAAEDEKVSAGFTAQLAKLEELKTSLLRDIPIDGLEVEGGELYLRGVPFDRVNEAERSRLAVEVMKLRGGRLNIMVLDRAEVFDSASWGSFREACLEAKVPIIAARVSDSDLRVQTDGGGDGA